MAFGFGVLKLSSRDFWAMTPREMTHAMRAHGLVSEAPLSRTTFASLMDRFPDQEDDQ